MRKTLAIAVSIWLLACPGFTADLSKDVAVASQIQLLDAWIQTQMKYNGLPGLVIGIVHDKEVGDSLEGGSPDAGGDGSV